MFYSRTLTIPASTPMMTPQRVLLPVTGGVVRHVWVRWRWGTGNLCGVRMKLHQYQHWPASGGEWFPSTTQGLDFDEDIAIAGPPYLLAIEGYSLDTAHPHDVWVAFNILRPSMSPNMSQFLADLGRIR